MLRLGVFGQLDYGLASQGVVFDPGTLLVTTMAATAAGGAASAAGTLMGGSYARTAGQMQQAGDNYQAAQLEQDANTAIGVAQRRGFERDFNTNMLLSTLRARASGGGISTASPSVVEDAGSIEQKGRYDALLDLWQGKNQASGILNQAAGLRYSGDVAAYAGEMQEKASKVAAVGTLMGTAGSMASQYGAFTYPSKFGAAGMRVPYG